MSEFKVSEGGRVGIPADLRHQYAVEVGDSVVWRDDGDGLRLFLRRDGVKRAQQVLAKYKRPGTGAVDELLRERSVEAARE